MGTGRSDHVQENPQFRPIEKVVSEMHGGPRWVRGLDSCRHSSFRAAREPETISQLGNLVGVTGTRDRRDIL
jgi:hypothetical protein